MARYAGGTYDTIGSVPSFGVPQAYMSGPGPMALSPAVMGSSGGVPGVDTLDSGKSGAQGALQYGLDKAHAGPAQQPLFWLFVMFILGVLMVAHFAHFNLREVA